MKEFSPKQEKLVITVEIAKPEEWEDLRKIRLEALEMDREAFGSNLKDEKDKDDQYWRDQLANPEKKFYVIARQGREPVGMTGAYRTDPQDYWWVFGVYVSGKARGRKIGPQILKRIEQEVKSKGGHKIGLEVREAAEQIPAFGMYIDEGYHLIRRRESERVKGRILYFMEKDLTR